MLNFLKHSRQEQRGTFAGLESIQQKFRDSGAICGPKIMANKELLEKKMERVKKFDEMINA